MTPLEFADKAWRVPTGKSIRLKDYDTAWNGDDSIDEATRKSKAAEMLSQDVERLAAVQEVLYAADSWSVLVILQAMDAAGKDGTIKHVMSGINPQGCQVTSFKHPSAEELEHNFLWRCARALPERGRIGIFNRSYYEEVLIVKVHQELVAAERIPDAKPNKAFWQARYDDINNFELHLARNGTKIVKFFLHLSRDEQRRRFLKRLDDPKKHWKFSPSDLTERGFWKEYRQAYEEALSATSTEWAPWYVIPADHKWVSRAMVANILVQTIESLNLRLPEISPEMKVEIEKARHLLSTEQDPA